LLHFQECLDCPQAAVVAITTAAVQEEQVQETAQVLVAMVEQQHLSVVVAVELSTLQVALVKQAL
jgi:hypothetical protein